jgi:hypothetical protein
VSMNSSEDRDQVLAIGGAVTGSFLSTAGALYLIAQIIHIRANTMK